jgi:hypothetical protein
VKLSAVGIMDWANAVDKETARRDELTSKLLEMDLRWGGSSGTGRSGTSENLATKSALLKKIQARLPEDSKIAPQLVGADLETLELFDKGQEKLRDFYKSNGLEYTPEIAEEDVTSFHREVIKTGGKVDVETIFSMLGIDEDMVDDIAYGDKTYGDIARSIAEGKEEVGLAFDFRSPVDPLSGSEQSSIRDLYVSSLRPTISSEITRINNLIAENQATPEDEVRVGKLQEALDAMESENKDYSLAAAIVGPEVAINIIKSNPRFKPYNYLINQNLNFKTKENIAEAINVGLIEEGTRIYFNGSSYTITKEDVKRAIS